MSKDCPCPGVNCPKRDTCHRFNPALDIKKEIYWAVTPYNQVTEKCAFYFGPEENALRSHVEDILNGRTRTAGNS